jgi:thiol-disulfide isomerase/thioredoxin
MSAGVSWSGHERNNVYLNLGDGRFADASHVSGLDFEDDGRAVAVVDWDGDGDLDLWLKNRTGPQLRFMHNEGGPSGHWIALRLEGTTSNRDAVGATVEIATGGESRTRTVIAGDGYLAQSSKWLHFGLGRTDRLERIVIRWPGGDTEELAGPAVDRAYRVKQGSGEATAVPTRRMRPASATPAEPLAESPPRLTPVLLKEPLPLPPTLRELLFGGGVAGRAKVLNLWAQWCAPCLEELEGLALRYADLQTAGVDVVALNVDPPEAQEQAVRVLGERIGDVAFVRRKADEETTDLIDALLEHVLQREGEVQLPTSLLVDRQGLLQLIYIGPLNADRLLADHARWIDSPVNGAERGIFPGRWYFRTPRDLLALATELKARELREDARFYLALAHLARSGTAPGD